MRAVIVSGGEPPSKSLLLSYLTKDDFLIGVDKGCNCLYDYNLKPNLILGDFDSANEEVIKAFTEDGIEMLKFNPEKDYTDSDLGYIKAKEHGANEILFFGATGSRVDHSLGNIGILLKSLSEGIKLEIIDDHNRIFLINEETTIKGTYGEIISFHALSDVVKNICIKGAKYELSGYDMKLLEPRAICNEFIDSDIRIAFDSGIIMVIFPED
ncbi:thiamine diphosphokinase [Clostridium vincentii]|uniref:Thiamine diphosphokinase n=1 Tax=Clostridium vincentii TaxID=52704 RepID=A0A2T0BJS3_9CLOT|nr:thiamine diphosphokinase [Clostridium vincentii]PRR84148.1 Thiamine pyrophosphokinase [Clostridium vincentii]